jgi:hypothetical protein
MRKLFLFFTNIIIVAIADAENTNHRPRVSYPGYTFFHDYIEQQAQKEGISLLTPEQEINPDAMSLFIELSNKKKNKLAYDWVAEWEVKAEDEVLASTAILAQEDKESVKSKIYKLRVSIHKYFEKKNLFSCAKNVPQEICEFARKAYSENDLKINVHLKMGEPESSTSEVRPKLKKAQGVSLQYNFDKTEEKYHQNTSLHELSHIKNDLGSPEEGKPAYRLWRLFSESRADVSLLKSYPEYAWMTVGFFLGLVEMNNYRYAQRCCGSHPAVHDRYKSARMFQELFYAQAKYDYEKYVIGYEKAWDAYFEKLDKK